MGGGEGSAARELFRHKTIEGVVMCDIDQVLRNQIIQTVVSGASHLHRATQTTQWHHFFQSKPSVSGAFSDPSYKHVMDWIIEG